MCGIFGYVEGNRKQETGNRKLRNVRSKFSGLLNSGRAGQAAKIVFEGLKKLEYRGYDSWGIVTKQEIGNPFDALRANRKLETRSLNSGRAGKLIVEKHVGKIGDSNFLPSRQAGKSQILNLKSSVALGHTRWATHGGVSEVNAHPHLDCSGNIAVVHNGIIENYLELKAELIKKGHKFKSATDSEVAVHLVEENFKKHSFKEAVRLAYLKLKGLNALIFLSIDSEIVAVKKGSPLVVGLSPTGNIIASDPSVLVTHTKDAMFLLDDEMVVIGGDFVDLYNAISNKKKELKTEQISWNKTNVKLGKFKHFMLKEIYEQPKVLENVVNLGELKDLSGVIGRSKGIFLIGCGTASYASLAGVYLFSKIAKKHVNFATGSEFVYLEEYLNSKTLVIALSQSGETIDVIQPVVRAKNRGAKIAGITNVLGSTLFRACDYKVLLTAGPELAVCATKSYSAMVATLILLTFSVASLPIKGRKVVLETAKSVKNVLKEESVKRVKALAKQISGVDDIFVIGRGLSYPAACEAALKLKEVSYIHSEGFAGGELKHGVIALIERGTPCIVFAPEDETYADIISNAIELKSRGAYIIGISPKNHEAFDCYLKVDNCGEGSVIAQTVPIQLLTYFIALEKGLDPDRPRNLAKSVTVK